MIVDGLLQSHNMWIKALSWFVNRKHCCYHVG